MLGILFIAALAVYIFFFYPIIKPKDEPIEDKNSRYAQQMKKLWSVAQDSMRQRKPLRAEKALLTILKFDEKNAAAYNRLGILYAKEQKFDEAIECFEIAQSLDNNPSSLHNAGLIYLETGAYEKAAIAFEQAIKLEGDIPARFIALAKSYEKLGKRKDALENLESAYSLSPTLTTLRQILALHEAAGDAEAVAATNARIEKQMAANAKARESRKKPSARSRLGRRAARPTIKPSSLKRPVRRSTSPSPAPSASPSSSAPSQAARSRSQSRPARSSSALARPASRRPSPSAPPAAHPSARPMSRAAASRPAKTAKSKSARLVQ